MPALGLSAPNRRRTDALLWLLAAALVGLWLLLAPPTPDLAAQVYRANLFHRIGFAVWDASWYGGHHMPGYSLIFPPLGAFLGARLTGAITSVISVVLFERLLRPYFSRRAVTFATVWFAFAVTCDLLIGRITFSLGVTFGLAAVLALSRRHPVLAAGLGVLCAVSSPVAGVFASLAGIAVVLGARRRDAIGLTVAPIAAVLLMAVLFPEGGTQPFVSFQILPPLLACVLVLVLARPQDRVLKIGTWLYVAGCLLTMVVPSPLGDNVLRLSATVGGPLILALWIDRRPGTPRLNHKLVIGAVALFAVWQVTGPIREVVKGVDDPSTHAAYYQPVADYITEHAPPGTRIEVPFTRGHWEAAYLAPHVPLARGWETQLDMRYGDFFYEDGVTPARYRDWLRRNAVRYVALPDAPLDPTAKAEAAVILSRPSWLQPVWSDEHWRVFRVTDPDPMVSGAGARLTQLDPNGFTLQTTGTGPVEVRVRPTPYFVVPTKNACVARSSDGWTHLRVTRPGTVRVEADLTLSDVLGNGAGCDRA